MENFNEVAKMRPKKIKIHKEFEGTLFFDANYPNFQDEAIAFIDQLAKDYHGWQGKIKLDIEIEKTKI